MNESKVFIWLLKKKNGKRQIGTRYKSSTHEFPFLDYDFEKNETFALPHFLLGTRIKLILTDSV